MLLPYICLNSNYKTCLPKAKFFSLKNLSHPQKTQPWEPVPPQGWKHHMSRISISCLNGIGMSCLSGISMFCLSRIRYLLWVGSAFLFWAGSGTFYEQDQHLLFERDRVPFMSRVGICCLSGIGMSCLSGISESTEELPIIWRMDGCLNFKRKQETIQRSGSPYFSHYFTIPFRGL